MGAQRVNGPSTGQVVVLCSEMGHFTPTLPQSTQEC